jgi:hypothetical protein
LNLKSRGLANLDSAFSMKYGIALGDFLRFTVALYVRFFGTFLADKQNPLLLDVNSDEALQKFGAEVRDKAIKLITQTRAN